MLCGVNTENSLPEIRTAETLPRLLKKPPQRRGRRLVLHGGSNPGFAAYIGRFIDDKVGVILMANLGDMNSYRLAEEIIALYLPE